MVDKSKFIIENLKFYNSKVKALNKLGLFDEAKHFELFAIELARIWFEKDFVNANVNRSNEPYIDLKSKDETLVVQVSTVVDCQQKINSTLEKFYSQNKIKSKLKFILLTETDVNDINIKKKYQNFNKASDIINLNVIFNKLNDDLRFVNNLYDILNDFFIDLNSNISGFNQALDKSHFDISRICSTINNEYKIERTKIIEKIKQCNKQNIFIVGKPGSGKSALCKDLLIEGVSLYARAEKFGEYDKLNEVWGFDFTQIARFSGEKPINIFIDSLESIIDSGDQNNLLSYLIQKCKKNENIKLYYTCRRNDINSILKIEELDNIELVHLDKINPNELLDLKRKFPILDHYDKKIYTDLLTNLWYVDMIVKMLKEDKTILNELDLRRIIWEEVCKDKNNPNNNLQRKNTLKSLILDRLNNNTVFVNKNEYNDDIITSLLSDDIVIENKTGTGIKLKYDIFEDLFFEREIDFLYENSRGDLNVFFGTLDSYGKYIYSKYKNWLEYKLLNTELIKELLEKSIFDIKSCGKWHEYTFIGLIKSDNCEFFFEKYKDALMDEEYIYFIRLVEYINTYCFELNNNYKNTIQLLSSGKVREEVIKLIVEHKLYEAKNLDSIIRKFIFDWTNGINIYQRLSQASYEFKKVIIYYLSLLESTNEFYNHELYFENLNMLYSISEISKDEILNKWNILKSYLEQFDDEKKFGFAKKIISETLRKSNFLLIKNLPNELCELASYYWKYEYNHQQIMNELNKRHYYMQNDKFNQFGLSNQFGLFKYDTQERLFITRSFVYPLLKLNFPVGFKFILDFLNDSITIFNDLEPNHLKQYTLLVEGIEKTYFGDESFWGAYRGGSNLPDLIKDMLMSLEYYLLNDVESYIREFGVALKIGILNKSNNIFLFPILMSFAFKHFNLFKDQFVDIASNIDIILMDVHRANSESTYRNMHNIGLFSKFEKDFFERFDNLDFRNESIQKYIIDIQFLGIDKTNVYNILDYLYSKNENTPENAVRYLNIQKMDYRNYDIEEVEQGFILEPIIDGAAEELTKNKAKELSPYNELVNKSNQLLKDITNGKVIIDECINIIEAILRLDRAQVIISKLSKVIEILIIYVISKEELNEDLRDKYINIMLEELKDLMAINNIGVPGVSNVFSKVVLFNDADYYVLWTLLTKEISKKIYDKIMISMLNIVLSGAYAGHLLTLLNDFLDKNDRIKNELFQIIIQIARYDMKSRIKYSKICNKKKKIFDYEMDLKKLYPRCKGRKNKIIKIAKIDVSKININILFSLFNCNFSIIDFRYSSFFEKTYSFFINKINNEENRMFDFMINNMVQNILKYNLLLDDNHAKRAIKLIFNINVNNISHDLRNFINGVFTSLLSVYFDSFDNPGKRNLIYNIWELIEVVIENNETLIKAFYLPLIFTGDNMFSWEEFKTSYSLKDKEFINKYLIKYGRYNVVQSIKNIDNLKSDELLPEILISIKELLEHIKFEEVINVKIQLVKIITKAYYKHFDYIRKDNKFYDIFIEILEILVDNKIPEAAFILEEIR